ncbi:MAG TPA: hypothetical protein VEB40_11575 [Flavipsychrobacter sp.]|nr:hypothetical protein [Flavipsychrobacter sp.]
MTKKITLLTAVCAFVASVSSFAQTSASATQTIHIQVAASIQIGNGNGNGNGNNNGNQGNGNNGNYNGSGKGIGKGIGNGGNGGNGNGNGNKMANNDCSSQEFTVNANKNFIVSVQTIDNTNDNILLALADNKTGGQVNPNFSSHYAPVSATAQDLLMNCAYGNEKSFSVSYKTKSNPAKKQNLTKADLIYTATLP